jgi:flagellar basal body rod protein FlgB
VDIENEMANLAENNVLFETMALLIRKKFQGLKFVIQGGGK